MTRTFQTFPTLGPTLGPRLGASLALIALTALGGCARWVLPSEENVKASPFASYEDAQMVFNSVTPMASTTEDLAALGLDPAATPNLKTVNYLDIMARFMPQQTVRLADLDPAVQACVNARESCVGYVLAPESVSKDRVGDVSLDMLGFERTTVSTGWRAEMLFLIVDDVVIYKLWSGTANIDETKTETRPLGPFQDLSGAATGVVKDAVTP